MVPVVKLSPWEYDWVNLVGARRYSSNWSRKDAKHYDKSRMEDDRTAAVAACAAELAVAKLTNSYWSGHVWDAKDHHLYKDAPDVGNNIEVRRIRTKDMAAVRRRQLGKGLVLFVARPVMPEIREVEVYGWILHDKAWEIGDPSDYDPDTRVVSIRSLNIYDPRS